MKLSGRCSSHTGSDHQPWVPHQEDGACLHHLEGRLPLIRGAQAATALEEDVESLCLNELARAL